MNLISLGLALSFLSAVVPSHRHAAAPKAASGGGGGTSFPSINGLYARYYVSNWSGWANGNLISTLTNVGTGAAATAPNLITTTTASKGYWTNHSGVANSQPFLALPLAGSDSYTNALVANTIPLTNTIYMVFKSDGTPNFDRVFDSGGATIVFEFDGATAANYIAGGLNPTGTINPVNPMLYRIDMRDNGSTAQSATIWTNDVQAITTTSSFNNVVGLSDPWITGYQRFGTPTYCYWEIVIITNQITATDNTNLTNYFHATYGVP